MSSEMEGLPLETEAISPDEALARLAMIGAECEPPTGSIDEDSSSLHMPDDPDVESTDYEQTSWKGRKLELADVEGLYIQYAPQIRAFLTHMVGAENAQDLTQETFIRLCQRVSNTSMQPIIITTRHPATFIYRIAQNLALDLLRRRGQLDIYSYEKLSAEADSSGDSRLANAFTATTSGGAFEESLITSMNVRETLLRMDRARYREVLLLYGRGFNYREIAEVLGTQESGVKMLLSRARKEYRKKYRELDQSA